MSLELDNGPLTFTSGAFTPGSYSVHLTGQLSLTLSVSLPAASNTFLLVDQPVVFPSVIDVDGIVISDSSAEAFINRISKIAADIDNASSVSAVITLPYSPSADWEYWNDEYWLAIYWHESYWADLYVPAPIPPTPIPEPRIYTTSVTSIPCGAARPRFIRGTAQKPASVPCDRKNLYWIITYQRHAY